MGIRSFIYSKPNRMSLALTSYALFKRCMAQYILICICIYVAATIGLDTWKMIMCALETSSAISAPIQTQMVLFCPRSQIYFSWPSKIQYLLTNCLAMIELAIQIFTYRRCPGSCCCFSPSKQPSPDTGLSTSRRPKLLYLALFFQNLGPGFVVT